MRKMTEERVERAIDTMEEAGLTNDQIKEIVAALAEMYAESIKDVMHGRN